jgi:hypothetical protein
MKVLGSTLNKKVKAEIAKMFPSANKIEKIYVSAFGYVWYIRENEKTIGRVHKACIGEEGVIKSYMVINEIKTTSMTDDKVKHI